MNDPGPLAAPIPRAFAEEVALLLASQGIATELTRAAGGVHILVNRAELARASVIVVEEYPEGLVTAAANRTRARTRPPARPEADRWFGPEAWIVFVIVAACVLVFVGEERAGGSEVRTVLLDFGASRPAHVRTGEYWRLVTAMFVHIGARHLLANTLTLLVLGPALAAALGAPRFAFVYVVAGKLGNFFSYRLADPDIVSAGASGAILGVLGALGSQRIRFQTSARYRGWQVVAALLAYLAIAVGAGPGVDSAAHIGGLVAGAGIGLLLPPPGHAPAAVDRGLSAACAGTALTLVVGAYLALVRAS